MQRDQRESASKRFATLQGAIRVLSPLPEVLERLEVQPRFAEIQKWLEPSSSSPGHDDRAKIDDALDQLTLDILEITRRVSFWELRKTIPDMLKRSLRDVLSLLEVCVNRSPGMIADPRAFTVWSDLVDYLVTLLVTAGGKSECDAHALFGGLSCLNEVCGRAAEEVGKQTAALERTFREACKEIERGEPIRPIIKRIREVKHTGGNSLFAPNVLESIVAYNVAAGRKTKEQRKRVMLQSLQDAGFQALAKADAETEGDANRDSTVLPAGSSVELGTVESALRERLAGRLSTDGKAAAIADVLETGGVSQFEREAFADHSDCRLSHVVRAMVTTGLVVRSIERIETNLSEIGIDVEWLCKTWIREVDELAKAETAELVRDRRFDEAQQLAETRTRHMNPLFSSEAPPAETAHEASYEFPPTETTPKNARRDGRKSGGSQQWRNAAMLVGFGLIIIAATVVHQNSQRSTVLSYSRKQLDAISPHLISGFRSGFGSGPNFIGTVASSWTQIPMENKRAAVEGIGEILGQEGITTIMFFDERARLQLDYSNGRIQHLR